MCWATGAAVKLDKEEVQQLTVMQGWGWASLEREPSIVIHF